MNERNDLIITKISEMSEKLHTLNNEHFSLWYHQMLFSTKWWIHLGIFIIPWVIFFIFRKKNSTDRLMYPALFLIIAAVIMDHIGISYNAWQYNISILPIFLDIPWDFTMVPVTALFLLQIKPNLSPIIKALIYSLFSGLVGEPFFLWIGFYKYNNWNFLYSVIIDFILYLIANYLANRNQFASLKTK